MRENYEEWLSQRLQGQNDDVEHNELQVVINPDATAEECLNNLGAQIEENDCSWAYLGEEHPELFCSDMLTIGLANVQLQTHLYYLLFESASLSATFEHKSRRLSIKGGIHENRKRFARFS